MKPINIYSLTRITDPENLKRLERQMSGRKHFLSIKEWEIGSLRGLVEQLEAPDLEFFYSFQIPKLGKEFDLIRISENMVVNIELKSEPVPDEDILKQLLLNRYYLSTLGRSMRFYTYISSKKRLVRLTNSGHIVEADRQTLWEDLGRQVNCFCGDIEDLFQAEQFIISPPEEPERFLNREYFLTSQQRDIERRILRKIHMDGFCYQGFTGLPGTGKTLLLYDIAMQLSERQRIALINCGHVSEKMRQLSERLKRIDFYRPGDPALPEKYAAILVDEAHRMSEDLFEKVTNWAEKEQIPLIFCYDLEEAVSDREMDKHVVQAVEQLPGFAGYRLTNRIRTNSELSAFVQCVLHSAGHDHRKEYPGVRISFAGNAEETSTLLEMYRKKGYTWIWDTAVGTKEAVPGAVEVNSADCTEFDRVVMLLDENFYYDEEHFLRNRAAGDTSPVRNLFYGLNRAKSGIALVVQNNADLFCHLLMILQ